MKHTNWTAEKNARRCALIDMDEISEAELEELGQLMRELLACRNAVAPLPLREAREMLASLNDMSEAKKLAEEMSEEWDWTTEEKKSLESHLQPTFDLLAQIHKLATNVHRLPPGVNTGRVAAIQARTEEAMYEIANLTRKYDEGQ